MRSVIGWIMFLLFNLVLAAGFIYITDRYMGSLWTFFWGALAVFSAYAVFLAVWLVVKTLKVRFSKS